MNIYDFIKVDENGRMIFFEDDGEHVLIRAASEDDAKRILLEQIYKKYEEYAESFEPSCITDLESYIVRYHACFYNFTEEDLASC